MIPHYWILFIAIGGIAVPQTAKLAPGSPGALVYSTKKECLEAQSQATFQAGENWNTQFIASDCIEAIEVPPISGKKYDSRGKEKK